jgi:hypothetical protein
VSHVYQCPRCELRFGSKSELEDHIADDHYVEEVQEAPEDTTGWPPGG